MPLHRTVQASDRPVITGLPISESVDEQQIEGPIAPIKRSIWLSPVNAQVERAMSARESDHLIAPYHGYWPIRGREVDARFGGNEALRAFVDGAHERGIRVLLDLINNQVHEAVSYTHLTLPTTPYV